MTWNDFNVLCCQKMGKYYSVMLFNHVPEGHHAVVVLVKPGSVTTCEICPTDLDRYRALSLGMNAVKYKIVGWPRRDDTGGWRE
jgi:hypothetical protein